MPTVIYGDCYCGAKWTHLNDYKGTIVCDACVAQYEQLEATLAKVEQILSAPEYKDSTGRADDDV